MKRFRSSPTWSAPVAKPSCRGPRPRPNILGKLVADGAKTAQDNLSKVYNKTA